tara:strand:- start:32 stop:4333 length:4302 start_codon:yes stop_codon:yes gene_type:complete
MTDALNVTISEDGDGTEGVLKNVRGTDPATAVSGSELTDGIAVTVIGSVSDSHRGFIYFFVSTDTGHAEDAIYQYNTSENTYKKVFKNTWLDFESSSFLKADVVNGAFQQDGDLQTIIYFTDNDNEPRKINVDRAIAGDYDDLSNDQLDYSLKAIKAPQVMAPTFNFDTDTSIPINNFARETFQFATQYVYKDGEESAISPYSKLAYPDHVASEGLEADDSGKLFFTDNRCDININWTKASSNAIDNPSDVEKVRLLARSGNEGTFFVVEEFNPNADLSRRIHSSSVKIYDSSLGVYKFYNNGLYGSVDSNTVNKLYDNVPRKARGQAYAGNRLFYSDYEEGRANHAISAQITPKYKSEVEGGAVLFSSTETAFITETASDYSSGNNYKLNLDFLGPSQYSAANETVEGGSLLNVSFTFDFEADLQVVAQGNIFEVTVVEQNVQNPDNYIAHLGSSSYRASALDLLTAVADRPSFTTGFAVAEDVQLSTFVTDFQSHLTETLGNTEYEIEYDLTTETKFVITTANGSNMSVGDELSASGKVKVTWAFEVVSGGSNTAIDIKPYVKKVLAVGDIGVSGVYAGGSVLGTLGGGDVHEFADQAAQRIRLRNEVGGQIDLVSDTSQTFKNFQASKSFKHGCHHDFGVVYYDKYNRSGNVNKIGGFYAEFPGERSGGKGTVSALVQFTDNAPDWADRYQIVYGGMKTFESVFSYTTGSAYPVKNKNSDGDYVADVDTNRKQLYVSLLTIDGYKEDKGALRDYTYSSGDKLRVIKYSANGSADPLTGFTYPMASDGSTIIEFNVVGVAVLGDNAENPLSSEVAGAVEQKHQGTFVIIEAPQVAAGIDDADGNTLQYAGFDWFDVTGNDHPGETGNNSLSHWGKHCVVEIVTPRKTPQQVYYEVGESHKVGGYKNDFNSDHGPDIYIDCADTYLKTTACLSPKYDPTLTPTWANTAFPQNWEYINIELESQSVSDFFSSEDWDRGRPHIYFEGSAEVNVFNGLTYSDPYSQDSSILTLSSFNASLANFDNLDNRYGAIQYIGNYNDDLVAIQENKLCLVGLGKNVLEYSTGSAGVAVASNAVGSKRYSAGDYGCGGHPEAVLIQDNSVYFVDESRQAVCALTGGQLVPISEKNMSSFFENFFTASHTKYVSGYDPRDNTYYLTGLGGSSPIYKTVGYDAARGVWQSRYSFNPDLYANQNNMLYSAKYVDAATDLIFHKHSDSTDHNTFYGTKAESKVQVVSKLSPSRVKVFDAISYEGDSNQWEMSTGATTNLNQTSGIIHDAAGDDTPQFVEKEGAYYAAMPKDTAVKYVYAGTFDSVSSNNITVTDIARLDRFPFLLDQTPLYYLSGGVYDSVFTTDSGSYVTGFSLSDSTITTAIAAGNPSNGDKLFFKVSTDGDAMRGSFMKVTLTLPTTASPTEQELYCINTHITDSKSHHALGQ